MQISATLVALIVLLSIQRHQANQPKAGVSYLKSEVQKRQIKNWAEFCAAAAGLTVTTRLRLYIDEVGWEGDTVGRLGRQKTEMCLFP